ncbi:MAG: zinc ribbon domain-containing protein [Thermodesulfovibrionales bacterium]|nr:zinc ribbon domain-containing protein [Thermodesulfovibrionales bacterium]
MPTYEYKCEHCGYLFEVRHSMTENPGILCPECKSEAKRIITGGSGFILKGSSTSSMKDNLTTKCGKDQTCCGNASPCEIRPCER